MVGEGLMVAPILYEGQHERIVYFPKERWFDLRELSVIPEGTRHLTVNGSLPLVAPFFLRGGYMFYIQNVSNVLRSADLNNEFTIIIGLPHKDSNGKAVSKAMIMDITDFEERPVWDECVEKNCLMALEAEFDYEKRIFEFRAERLQNPESEGLLVKKFIILGIEDLTTIDFFKGEVVADTEQNGNLYFEFEEFNQYLGIWNEDRRISIKDLSTLSIKFSP